jgi:hypothetical protein
MRRLAIAGLLLAAPLRAQERSLVIERFDATIKVNQDATLDVTESITPRFTGSWNGIYRAIPVEYRTPQGFNWSIRLDLLSVTDEAGHRLKIETSRQGHYVKYKVWVPGARDAVRHVVLRYQVKNGLRFFDDHDELYWNVTGDEWEVPIAAAAARIELPAGAGAVRAIAFNGAYGSTARDALVSKDGSSVSITMPHPLAFHEGLTAVVGWNKGAVAEPTETDRVAGFLATNWPLLLPVPVFVLMLVTWQRRGRDPRRLPITVQYEPPDRLTPAEAGTLIDNSADMRDITATIVDLAVKGYLKIEETHEAKLFGLVSSQDFAFHLTKPRAEWSSLAGHERQVLDGMFDSGGDTVHLKDLENEFYREIPGIKRALFDQLIDHGYYQSRPDTVRGGWLAFAVGSGAVIGIGGSVLGSKWGMSPAAFAVAGILVTLVIGIFGFFMPARTVPGARALEKVLGFEEFLNRVESDRLERVAKTPELFERCLPFAMAFGVAPRWAKAFKDIYVQPPTWYVGTNFTNFNATTFSSRLTEMSTRTSSTLSSSPRSSSGSGFSGGSSGGGGGGGGGGGF